MEYGCSSEVDTIKRLLLKHPSEAFIDAENIGSQWMDLNYLGFPDFNRASSEFERFVELLERHINEIHYLPRQEKTGLDSIYVHDPMVMTPAGAVLCNMGKEQRKGEPAAMEGFLTGLAIPILGAVTGDGRLEGGDVVMFDKNTLAVAEGYRTNREGIRQLQNLTNEFIPDFQVVPLPHWQGPNDVLHLMSIISPVDHDLAVVYSRLMPVPFREWLISRGIKLVEVPDTEFETMGCNVLAVSPRKCIMMSGNPRTRQLLENEGAEVWEYEGEEISKKGAGGPTCLTRPLWRAD
jgi:N-dimethylarginine dimethylaminohydrolase